MSTDQDWLIAAADNIADKAKYIARLRDEVPFEKVVEIVANMIYLYYDRAHPPKYTAGGNAPLITFTAKPGGESDKRCNLCDSTLNKKGECTLDAVGGPNLTSEASNGCDERSKEDSPAPVSEDGVVDVDELLADLWVTRTSTEDESVEQRIRALAADRDEYKKWGEDGLKIISELQDRAERAEARLEKVKDELYEIGWRVPLAANNPTIDCIMVILKRAITAIERGPEEGDDDAE